MNNRYEVWLNGKYIRSMETKVEEKAYDMYCAAIRVAKYFNQSCKLELKQGKEVLESDIVTAKVKKLKAVTKKGKKVA